MNQKSNNSASICATCPRRRFGLCKVMVELLKHKGDTHSLQRSVLAAKQHLFHQGEQLQATYVLREGWIQLYRVTEEGKRQVFPSVLPGELLGLHADAHASANYSAVALQDSLICIVPNLVSLCLSDAKLALRLAWVGGSDTLLTEMYLANITHCSARERIAFLALELYRRLELRGINNGYTIPFSLNQADIADTLGLTPIHVSRSAQALREEGLLEIHKHELTILDYPAICSLVGAFLEPISECDIAPCWS
jgi:CRP-like cAMP-binding protein